MMNIQHNKKRNVGIIYELLLRSISASLVEGNKKKAQDALDIISKYYDKSTELYKEYRLFNALVKSTVSDTPVAASVLSEAKSAARRFDLRQLDHEKSLLIRDINHNLQDQNFYHRRIPDYRYYATVQNLMNEWSIGDRSDLVKTVTLEGQVVHWLLKEKVELEFENEKPNMEVDGLVVKIMSEKFNQKYGNKLNESQTQLIRDYIFSVENNQEKDFLDQLVDLRERALDKLGTLKLKTENTILQERIPLVEASLRSITLENLDDETISKFMTVSQLVTELSEEEGEND
jgi:hypothetical protein